MNANMTDMTTGNPAKHILKFGLGMIYVPRALLNGCADTGFAMINGISEAACRILYSQLFTRIPLLG